MISSGAGAGTPAPAAVATPGPSVPPGGVTSVDTTLPKPVPTLRTRCRRPLAEFCRSGPCPTRTQGEKELRSLIGRYKATDSGCLRIASLGRCGGLYVVAEADGYTSATSYFNERGVLVGAERTSDTNSYCDGASTSATYGSVPACERRVTEDLCAGVVRRDDGL